MPVIITGMVAFNERTWELGAVGMVCYTVVSNHTEAEALQAELKRTQRGTYRIQEEAGETRVYAPINFLRECGAAIGYNGITDIPCKSEWREDGRFMKLEAENAADLARYLREVQGASARTDGNTVNLATFSFKEIYNQTGQSRSFC